MNYRVFKLITVFFLIVSVLATLQLASDNSEIRSRAAGTAVGQVFCHGKEMCPDGHCVGDSWEECNDCPEGRARVVTEVTCGSYRKTDCIHETLDCPPPL